MPDNNYHAFLNIPPYKVQGVVVIFQSQLKNLKIWQNGIDLDLTSDHTLILRWWILPKISQSTSALDPASRKCSPYIWPGLSETPWRIMNHLDRFRCVDCFRKRMPRASKEGNSNSTSLEALKKSSSPNREDGKKNASAESTMVWNSNSKGKYSAQSQSIPNTLS